MGPIVSVTVTSAVQVPSLPLLSVTVSVVVLIPMSEQSKSAMVPLPEARLQLSVEPPSITAAAMLTFPKNPKRWSLPGKRQLESWHPQ